VIGLLALFATAWAHAQDASGDTDKAIRALEARWMESQRTNNPDLVAPLLADGIVSTSADGKVTDKAGMLASARASKFESVDYTDIKVSVYGNTAIAIGGFHGKGTDSAGKPIGAPERWTDTWVKMDDGTWKCVATHSSLVAN
jgi:uncharacterized protein (TIGR02246 family)